MDVDGSYYWCKGWQPEAAHTVEQPDSAQSMARCRMLLALGEGEFAGGLDATSIFLDGTPLGNADGTMNFEKRFLGISAKLTQTQTPTAGLSRSGRTKDGSAFR
ncbi:hypothetical protein ACVXG7_09260 [Enterobacter hormaechei]